ncbi:MAG: dTDP-4-dehydrorhamnose 3,5-epimerase [Candidatus Paracaedibacteraceae bacterium]|nr:dTDP-4-dehydrorhamnose 3,5-epimerase [Candidatus Paracaedibacteraceae bacterium]
MTMQLEQPQHIKLKAFGDNRGIFFESYNKKKMIECGITNQFCQDNFSYSTYKNTIRGLHFQKGITAQAKLVLPLHGKIFDVIVDLRQNSQNYLHTHTYLLDSSEPSCLYVPKGFAHGFCTLEDNVSVLYKVDAYYCPEDDGGIIWNDPELAINWPLSGDPVISEKDAKLPTFKNLTVKF